MFRSAKKLGDLLEIIRPRSQSCVKHLSSSSAPSPDLPSHADVVVIGGGSVGCNTLFHLAEMGHTNVVLLEKDSLTAGTTWHTAGLLWRLRPSDVDIQLIDRARELNKNIIPQKYGFETGWIENGGLFIASRKERLDEYKRLMTIGHAFGIESHVLGPEETAKLYPLMNVNDVYGTLYSPGDGLIDPTGICNGLARAAKSLGAKVFENCAVDAIETDTDEFGNRRVTGVRTPHGLIKTNAVANCAGAWGPDIGEMAGVPVPLCVMRHAYVITDKIDGIAGMPNTRDHDDSIYLRLQGDALAVGGYEPNPEFIDDLPRSFAFSLYDLNWDVFGVHIDAGCKRVPALTNTGIKSEVCGPESFTADHKPLLGESPQCRGFYLGCGFNSAGMMLGSGCGQQLAHWIIHGRPELFMHSYDIRRFYSGLVTDNAWIKQRSHESYAKNYAIVFPYDEPLAARDRRKDAFHDVLLKAGCVYQERLGWERPGWFLTDGTAAPLLDYDYYGFYGHANHKNYRYDECLQYDYTFEEPKTEQIICAEATACRNAAALFNMSYFGKYIVSGPDSQQFIDWVFAANLRVPPGATVYTTMLNDSGGIEADLTVSTIDTGLELESSASSDKTFYIAVGGAIAEHCLAHMNVQRAKKNLNVTISNITDNFGMLSLQGPRSRDILSAILPSGTDLSDDGFPFAANKILTFANGHKCRVIRLSFVGELGYEFHIPNKSCLPIYDAIMNAGQPLGLVNSGYRAIDALSMEKGYRLWGTDIRNDVTPLEAGLLFTAKLKSDIPFCGRDALQERRKIGAKKKYVMLSLENSHDSIWGLETVYRNGEVAGYLQRAEYAPTLKMPIGAAYITKPDHSKITNDYLKSGTYEIEIMGRRVPANIHLKSPFDPENKRIKGIYD